MRTFPTLLLLALAAAAAAGPAQAYDALRCLAPPARVLATPTRASAARAALERALADDHGGGAQAAVMRDGRLLWSEAVGIGAEPAQPLTRRAQMRIGSVSKLFTAMAAARLAAAGRLDLDAPIQSYAPTFPAKGAPITARLLASHTSGVRHYNFRKLSEGNNTARYSSLTDALRLFSDDPLVAEPGTRTTYSSFGFNLLGVAVERASRRPFPAALEQLVSRPYGLTGSGLDEPASAQPCRTDFFTIVGGERRTPAPARDSSDYYPSGGLLSTAEDLARLGDGAFRGSATPAKARELITTRARLTDGSATDYTFGWQVGLDPAGRIAWYGHGGTTNGAYASLRHYPRSGVTVAVIANYNFFATNRPPAILRAAREELPRIFEAEGG